MNKTTTILIIDDNHDTLDLLELFLYKRYNLVTEMNGFEGLKRAEELVPDLIITDIMMPEMDGIRLINTLKKKPKISMIPIVAVTSFSKKNNIKSLLNLGFSNIIVKPFSRDSVLDVVEQTLPQRGNIKGAKE